VRLRSSTVVALALLVALSTGACGGGDDGGSGDTAALSGRIVADGSSTVAPFTTRAAERFGNEHRGVRVTVGVSGTGGGFERFCAGETDVSNASRAIEADEVAACRDNGVDYVEFQVANDALTVVVNKRNDWATCLTTAQLQKIWRPGSEVDDWRDVDPAFPPRPLELVGPGTDSGTFDYFTGAINGEEGASRSDYTASENDNVIVRGVDGTEGALGYFGFSYFEENRDALRALEVDGGDGCVAPSVETAQDGSYAPLSRPLLVYVKTASFARPEVEAFVEFMLRNARSIAEDAQFVPLTDRQVRRAQRDFRSAAREAGA
jgi:phosphate transport system substrate-binding protein